MTASKPRRLFRKLTATNWREHDGTADHIVRVRADGSSIPMTEDDWAAAFLKSELSNDVPEDVRNLFEVAQGVLCYGCHFYPLYTFGSEQFYRVMEAALHHKCVQLEAPNKINTFAKRIEWLKEKSILSTDRFSQWDAARRLRNMTSHADRQSLYDPIMAVSNVRLTAELINELFQSKGIVSERVLSSP